MNLVEMCAGDQHESPCRFGNIVDGHACYCHHDQGPRKCPIWRNYGEHDRARWHNRGDWDKDAWQGGCRFFVANAPRDTEIGAGRPSPSTPLLACPFCGCDPVHQRVEEYCEGEWYVVCEVCRATGPRCDTEERARRYWNQGHAK